MSGEISSFSLLFLFKAVLVILICLIFHINFRASLPNIKNPISILIRLEFIEYLGIESFIILSHPIVLFLNIKNKVKQTPYCNMETIYAIQVRKQIWFIIVCTM